MEKCENSVRPWGVLVLCLLPPGCVLQQGVEAKGMVSSSNVTCLVLSFHLKDMVSSEDKK